MDLLVSVIVPVYNVEKYLERCLESLAQQTLDSIEIIVINDGSTDGSQKIIDMFVQLYPDRFSAYSKENGGLSDARNFGIPLAKGQYIGFIDSDDYVDKYLYEALYSKAKQSRADVVICDFYYEWEKDSKRYLSQGLKSVVHLSNKKRAFLSPLFAWNKIYRREFFLNLKLQYPLGLWYEDIPVTLPIFAFANEVEYVSEPLIHYVQRASSILGSKSSHRFSEIFLVLKKTIEYFIDNDLIKEYEEELEYVFIEQLMLYGTFRFMKSDNSKLLLELADEMMCTHFPNWKNNTYLLTLPIKYRVYLKVRNKILNRILQPLIRRK